MSGFRVVLAFVVASCLLAPAASAGPPVAGVLIPCHDYDMVRRQLAERYGEAPVSAGVRSTGELVEVFASPRRGTWTIVSSSPAGLACVLAAGKGWDGLKPQPPGPPMRESAGDRKHIYDL